MENLVFIIFIILFSIISTVLKSKKGTPTRTPAPPQRRREEYDNGYPKEPKPSSNEDNDILKEIELIFNQEKQKPEHTYDPEPEPQQKAAEPIAAVEVKPVPVPAVNVSAYEVEQKEYSNDPRFQFEDTRANAFRNKIQDPDNVRAYMLISEILGKPKALRR